jgi:hypothetical protein
MVANRVCAPASKLYCYEQWLREDVHMAGTEFLELQHPYWAMDFLEANKEAIERAIFFRVADLRSLDIEVIVYDTASLHFDVDEEDRGVGDNDEVRAGRAGGQAPKCECELRSSGRYGRYLKLNSQGIPRLMRAS